ncbi:WD repeat-containing protein 6-like [Dendronephthya gigantea]|uniref:WD repeat-containing protein 6-like n=1 Tax=Dendronephthya gigantea TaxID=151771 RepID=UPI00106D859D|nr:WD repeat-containing protein 6-like [Dendronephthya gigantea]
MNSDASFTVVDRELIAPVTALEFDEKGNLFVGEGPYLKIYDATIGELVTKERIFESQRIHSIKLYHSDTLGTRIVICGGRIVRVLDRRNSGSTSKVETIHKETFNDWIWDVCLLQETTTEESNRIAVVTGHNAVWIYDFNEAKKWLISQCEEQCILYCARFIGRTLKQMWLACGTVFNEVLLWKVTDKSQCSCDGKVLVKKRLTGHDGVIFSVRYSEDRGLLCSVSDDRSIQVWRAVFAPDYSDVTVSAKPLLTLYGHKARVWDCLILKNHIVSIGEDSMYFVVEF